VHFHALVRLHTGHCAIVIPRSGRPLIELFARSIGRRGKRSIVPCRCNRPASTGWYQLDARLTMIFILSVLAGCSGGWPRQMTGFLPGAIVLVMCRYPRPVAESGLCVDEPAGKQFRAVRFAGQWVSLTVTGSTGSRFVVTAGRASLALPVESLPSVARRV
jgi:hypothetical protein